MEPGHEDREYPLLRRIHPPHPPASMEPGHEDREYLREEGTGHQMPSVPQWSPVMKTGNTRRPRPHRRPRRHASMEPGHEDREYGGHQWRTNYKNSRLNGARS